MNIKKANIISFKKEEIHQIMELYSRKISIGEWKDYSISFRRSYAVFSIHKSYKLGPSLEIKNQYQRKDIYSLRQNSKKTYHKDGVFYMARNDYILNASNLLEGKIKGIINNFISVNIDTYEDLDYANFLIKKTDLGGK